MGKGLKGLKGRKRAAFNAVEARACCECRHWRRVSFVQGKCRRNQPADENATRFPQVITGMYATCPKWERRQ